MSAAPRALIIAAVIVTVCAVQCGTVDDEPDGPVVTARLAVPLQPSSALLMIAEEQGFFAANNLSLEVRDYPSGKRALHDGLFAGEADLAGSADLPVTIASLSRNDFRILASTLTADNVNSIVARRDAGIHRPADLAGKRIGTQRSSAVHYFLHLFLLEQGLSDGDAALSFFKAEELPGALAEGRVDAFSMRDPFISQARSRLGDQAVVFSSPGLYVQMEILVASRELIEEKPEVIDRLLRALLTAEDFAHDHPGEAIAIVAERLDTDPEQLTALWPGFQLRVSLDQSLLIRLEDEARWAIQEQITERQTVPNLLDLIMTENLKHLREDRVTIH